MNASQKPVAAGITVVGVDYSELGDLALERALDQAKANPLRHLHVVYVEPGVAPGDFGFASKPPVEPFEKASARLLAHVEKVIQRWCNDDPSQLPLAQLTTHVRGGNPAQAIAQLASDVEAQLVVVGTHGRRGAQRVLLGSVAEGVVRLAPCAVLVVRQPNSDVPQIEPPCPKCLEARRESQGKAFWCEQHAQHHERRHTYHYRPGTGAHQSGFLIHT